MQLRAILENLVGTDCLEGVHPVVASFGLDIFPRIPEWRDSESPGAVQERPIDPKVMNRGIRKIPGFHWKDFRT